jgi:mRNA interferase RelE/StbE
VSYSLQLKPVVEKDLKTLPKTTILRAIRQIIALQIEPQPPQSIKLSGMEAVYRLRVGDYRIIYEINKDAELVIIHYIRHRRDVYRKL